MRFAALKTNGRATRDGFLLANVIARARCRSLSTANAASRTPSLVSRASPPPCGRLHSCADNVASRLIDRVSPPGHEVQRFSGARVPGRKTRRCATRQGNGSLTRPANGRKFVFGTTPGRTEPTLRRAKHRHGLARARPDSPALRPLHSAARTLALQALPADAFVAFRRPQTAETGGNRRALPRWNNS